MNPQEPQNTVYGQYAGFVTRLAAFVIDLVIVALVISLIGAVIGFATSYIQKIPFLPAIGVLPDIGLLITTMLDVVFVVVYYVGFWMSAGQTPGKRFMGVRIVRTDGERVRWGNVLRRFAGYWLSLTLFLGFLWVLLDDQRQAWHDSLAGTLVIYSRPKPVETVPASAGRR